MRRKRHNPENGKGAMAQVMRAVTSQSLLVRAGANDIATGPVSAISTSKVDEPNASTSAYFDSHPFGARQRIPVNDDEENKRELGKRQHFGFFNAPTETFAAIMELSPNSNAFSVSEDDLKPSAIVWMARAVREYEQTLVLGSKDNARLGTELSVLL